MNSKWILKSKTFWVNAVSGILQLVQLWSGQHPIDPTLLAVVTSVLTLLLRWLGTSQPVTLSKAMSN